MRSFSQHGRKPLPGGRNAENPVALSAAEAEQVGGFAGEAMSFPFLQAGILLSVLCYMIWLEPLLSVVALASLMLTPRIQRRINALVEKRVSAIRALGDGLEAEGSDGSLSTNPDVLAQQVYRYRIRIFTLKFFLKGANNFLAAIGPLAILMVGGWMVIHDQTRIGTVVAFMSGFERLTSPIRDLINFYRRLSQVRVQYQLLASPLQHA